MCLLDKRKIMHWRQIMHRCHDQLVDVMASRSAQWIFELNDEGILEYNVYINLLKIKDGSELISKALHHIEDVEDEVFDRFIHIIQKNEQCFTILTKSGSQKLPTSIPFENGKLVTK